MANDLDNRVERYLCKRIEELETLEGDDRIKAEKQFNDMYGNWNKAYEINYAANEKIDRLDFEKDKAEKDRKIKALEGQAEFERIRLEREKLSKQKGIDILKCVGPVAQTVVACGFSVVAISVERAILNEGNIVSGAIRNCIPKMKFF